MQHDEVIATIKDFAQGALEEDYADLKVVDTLEAGITFMVQGKHVITVTLDDARSMSAPCKEDRWRFLLNIFSGSQPYSKNTIYKAGRDDIAFASDVRAAFNSDAGYAALLALGIYQSDEAEMCRAWPEDQRTPEMINPHLLTFSTF